MINADMLDSGKHDEKSVIPNHWAVLNSSLVLTAKSVCFHIYTWGDSSRRVPKKGILSLKSFLNNYYGFIAVKS